MHPLNYVIVDNDKKEIVRRFKYPSACFNCLSTLRKNGMNVSWFNVTHPSTPDEFKLKW